MNLFKNKKFLTSFKLTFLSFTLSFLIIIFLVFLIIQFKLNHFLTKDSNYSGILDGLLTFYVEFPLLFIIFPGMIYLFNKIINLKQQITKLIFLNTLTIIILYIIVLLVFIFTAKYSINIILYITFYYIISIKTLIIINYNIIKL